MSGLFLYRCQNVGTLQLFYKYCNNSGCKTDTYVETHRLLENKRRSRRIYKTGNLHKMKQMLEDLPFKIHSIKSFEVGINFNTSKTAFDISLYSEFEDEKGLEIYQKHPAHQEVATFIKAITKDRAVVDYLA